MAAWPGCIVTARRGAAPPHAATGLVQHQGDLPPQLIAPFNRA